MPSTNEVLQDLFISHQIGLARLTTGEVKKIERLLARLDAELLRNIRERVHASRSSGGTERLRFILADLRRRLGIGYRRITRTLVADLIELGAYESEFSREIVVRGIPRELRPRLDVATVSQDIIRGIVRQRPFHGRLLGEWFVAQSRFKQRGIRRVIEQGVAQGETIDQMVRRVRRGVLSVSRNHAESVVRTATSHVTQGVRDEFYDGNSDLIEGVQWLSTLDGRTSSQCIVRDGKQYDLNRKPIGHSYPWGGGPGRLHFQCRSTSVAILKSWRDLGFDADDVSAGTRASMDGRVPPKTTFNDFLKRKAKEAGGRDFVRDVLGKQRAEKFFQGATVDRFVDDQGVWL